MLYRVVKKRYVLKLLPRMSDINSQQRAQNKILQFSSVMASFRLCELNEQTAKIGTWVLRAYTSRVESYEYYRQKELRHMLNPQEGMPFVSISWNIFRCSFFSLFCEFGSGKDMATRSYSEVRLGPPQSTEGQGDRNYQSAETFCGWLHPPIAASGFVA